MLKPKAIFNHSSSRETVLKIVQPVFGERVALVLPAQVKPEFNTDIVPIELAAGI
jgi:hypothetical protein